MSQAAPQAPDPVTQADAYIASLFHALGSRDPLEVLESTGPELSRLTKGVPAEKLARAEAPGKWSMIEVIQHLADSEVVGAFRYRMIIAHDVPPIPGYDQDRWAARLHYSAATLESAMEQFAILRKINLGLLRATTPEERARFGIHAERGEESVEKMMRMYAGHDILHLRQLARIRSQAGM